MHVLGDLLEREEKRRIIYSVAKCGNALNDL